MHLPDLEALVALAETGSLNRAAARLHVTQSAISRRLKNLEAVTKAKLLDRNVKPPRITEAGLHLVQNGRQILHAVYELRASVSDNHKPKGLLRLGVAPGIAEFLLGSPLDAIAREFGQVQLSVRSGWSAGLIDLVRTGELDAAAVLLAEPNESVRDLSIHPLSTDCVTVIASKSTKIPTSPNLKALSAFPWVLNPKGCGFRNALERAFTASVLPLRLYAEIQGYELQMSLVARGVALGFAPVSRLRASIHHQTLRQLSVRGLRIDVTSALVWPTSQTRFVPVLDAFQRSFSRTRLHAQAA